MRSTSLVRTLIKSWFWLHFASLAAILVQPTQPISVLGRYSKTAFIALIAFAVTLPVVFFVSRWLDARLQRDQQAPRSDSVQFSVLPFTVIGLCIAAIFVIWLINLGPTASYLVVRIYLSVILITFAVWALILLPASLAINLLITRIGWVILFASALFVAILSRTFPALLWADEGIGLNAALTWVRQGRVALSFLGYVPYGPLFSLTNLQLGLWLSVFGPTLEAARFYLLLVGMASAALCYKAAALLYSRGTAILAAMLVLYATFLLNYVRVDMGVTLYLSLALYCFVRAEKKQQLWLHLIVGLIVGWGLDGHPNTYRFVIAFGLAYLFEYARSLWIARRFHIDRRFVYLVAGELLGLAAYFGFYSLIAHDAFLSTARNPGVAINIDFGLVPGLLFSQLILALQNVPVLTGAALLGVVVALRRHNVYDRLLLIVIFSSALTLAITYPYFRNFYVLHSVPLYVLLAAGLFYEIEQRLRDAEPKRWVVVQAGLAMLLVAANLGWLFANVLGGQSYADARIMAKQLRTIVPTQERFVGVDPFYLEMSDYPNFIELNAGILLSHYAHIEESTAWEQIAPTSVAIVSGFPIAAPVALLDYIKGHGLQKVRCWQAGVLGQVDLYMQTVPAGITPTQKCEMLDGVTKQ